MLSKDSFIKLVERLIPGMDIVPLEIGKNVIEDMENNVLNASSEMCQILANDPNLQQGYIPISFFKRLQMLKDLAEKCQIPTMKDMVSVSGRKFKKCPQRTEEIVEPIVGVRGVCESPDLSTAKE
ncbi:palmitoyl-protein thioesterase 1-like [Peromyscus eremicus]|uniref:palmitoyl-protein thioesterase 1-like n=1 Tax=Peromyscus eremicus TaxID=42410 RepID=UPI0027DBA8FD|nr:palmitoyl-protein thioesterase 1-like [Peromyscus eremicus]